jgi:hypothetical protein
MSRCAVGYGEIKIVRLRLKIFPKGKRWVDSTCCVVTKYTVLIEVNGTVVAFVPHVREDKTVGLCAT